MAATRFARLVAALAIAAGLMAVTRFARLVAALAIAATLTGCRRICTPISGSWRHYWASGRAAARVSTRRSSRSTTSKKWFSPHIGKPFLTYVQRTRAVADGRPLHAETGYLRVPQPGEVELVLAHPTGVTEIEVGTYQEVDGVIEVDVSASTIGLTPSAKQVSALARRVRIEGDQLSYAVQMGAVGQPLRHHLAAILHRRG